MASSVKMVGMMKVRALIVQMAWCLAGLSVHLPLLSSLAPQNPEDGMYHLVGTPHEWVNISSGTS